MSTTRIYTRFLERNLKHVCAGAAENMLIGCTEIESGTVVVGADAFFEFEVE